MISSEMVKRKIINNGAEIGNIAPLSRFEDASEGFHPSDIYPDCKSVIVFATHFPLETLQAKTNSPYTLARNLIVQKLDVLSFFYQMNWKKPASHQFQSLHLILMIIGMLKENTEGIYFH